MAGWDFGDVEIPGRMARDGKNQVIALTEGGLGNCISVQIRPKDRREAASVFNDCMGCYIAKLLRGGAGDGGSYPTVCKRKIGCNVRGA